MIRAAFLAASFGLFAAGPAAALSCAAPDALAEYIRARDAVELYVVVHGTFVPNRAEPHSLRGAEAGQVWQGRLTGLRLTGSGFDAKYDARIEWRAAAIGSWAAGPPPETPIIAFVALTGTGPAVETNACGGGFAEAGDVALGLILDCHRGVSCGPWPLDERGR